jgi:hypothetical protein
VKLHRCHHRHVSDHRVHLFDHDQVCPNGNNESSLGYDNGCEKIHLTCKNSTHRNVFSEHSEQNALTQRRTMYFLRDAGRNLIKRKPSKKGNGTQLLLMARFCCKCVPFTVHKKTTRVSQRGNDIKRIIIVNWYFILFTKQTRMI